MEEESKYATKEFRCTGRRVKITNCPINITAFKEMGWQESEVVDRALVQIFNSYLGPILRQKKELLEYEFELPPLKTAKTKTIDLSKLTEEQKKMLMDMGLM